MILFYDIGKKPFENIMFWIFGICCGNILSNYSNNIHTNAVILISYTYIVFNFFVFRLSVEKNNIFYELLISLYIKDLTF